MDYVEGEHLMFRKLFEFRTIMSEYRAPPPETMFLHRKLVGSFMLCSRIGARVDVQKLIRPFLPAS
jgi:hypothetical protein